MIRISSFSFKKGGAPDDAMFVFDCRKLRNPHYRADLRDLDGLSEQVQNFVESDPEFGDIYAKAMFHALSFEHPHVAFGCFGGRHRSVAAAEMIAKGLRDKGHDVAVTHRELQLA